MAAWQYAQLTVTCDDRSAGRDDQWTITWYGPDAATQSRARAYDQVAAELNHAGMQGWELIDVVTLDAGGSGRSYGGDWSLARYTFRRPYAAKVPPTNERSQKAASGRPEIRDAVEGGAIHRKLNSAESNAAEPVTLVEFTVYWLRDGESADSATDGRDLGPDIGRLLIQCEVVRPRNQEDIDSIKSLRAEYERPNVSKVRREEIREEIKAAAADYAASWVLDRLGIIWWKTQQSFPLCQAADLLDGSAEWLRDVVKNPLSNIASSAGAEGPVGPISAGITANFVTAKLTAPLGRAARLCEVTAIVIGLATGAHPLVVACAKQYAHDKLGEVLAEGFKQIINSTGADREQAIDEQSSLDATEADDTPRAEADRLSLELARHGFPDTQQASEAGPATDRVAAPRAVEEAKKDPNARGGITAV